jgi:hypothetical protein
VIGLPDGFDYIDLGELLDAIHALSDFLHPGTSHAEPGDEEALDRAMALLNRYRPAS